MSNQPTALEVARLALSAAFEIVSPVNAAVQHAIDAFNAAVSNFEAAVREGENSKFLTLEHGPLVPALDTPPPADAEVGVPETLRGGSASLHMIDEAAFISDADAVNLEPPELVAAMPGVDSATKAKAKSSKK